MKKNIKNRLIWAAVCLLVLPLAACNEDDGHPAPSNADIDWFARQDNPDDALDHRLFEIYEESGIGIFYSDKLGSQERGTYADGHPYVFDYILDLAYFIDGSGNEWGSQLSIDIRNPSAKRKGVSKAVDLLEQHVIPNLPEGLRPKGILLSDSLTYMPFAPQDGNERDIRSLRRAFRGMNTLGLAQLPQIDAMDAVGQAEWAARALAACYTSDLMAWDPVRIREYYALSDKPGEENASYYGSMVMTDYDDDFNEYLPTWESFGFLYYSEDNGLSYSPWGDASLVEQARASYNNFHDGLVPGAYIFYYNLPTQREDVEAFLAAAITTRLTGSDAWFEVRYDRTQYSVLYAKYEMMKKIVNDYLAVRGVNL